MTASMPDWTARLFGNAVDDPAARHCRASCYRLVPTQQMRVFLDGQELVGVVNTIEAARIPRPDRHIRDRVLIASEELVRGQMRVQHMQLPFGLHRVSVDRILDL